MIPDLVVWIDCDPNRAIERIKHATLRMSSDKQEYFETPEIQKPYAKGSMIVYRCGKGGATVR